MSRDYGHVLFISAGAGSGKTYRLTDELERALVAGEVTPARVIGTTFTVKAATELRERVRERLIRAGRAQLAEQTAQALLGTVHSVCERLLKRFAFELGLTPELSVASLEDVAVLFSQALDSALSAAAVREMNAIAQRLAVDDWRDDVRALVDRARDNDIPADALSAMGRESADSLTAFLPASEDRDWDKGLRSAVRSAIERIDLKADTTKGTAEYVADLELAAHELARPSCPWPVWTRLSTAEAKKKSDAIAGEVRETAAAFERHPRFHAELRAYIEGIHAIAGSTLAHFQAIKTERGLIDFQDMEQLTLRALDEPDVRERLSRELDLLLVDEFQDTNPMQLAIFMKLAEFAKRVIFVGDVKQAVFGFRGCDPELVLATLGALRKAGSKVDVLPKSWRSRPALVHYVNAVFTQAFTGQVASEEVALSPEREEQTDEPAIIRWQLEGRGEARTRALSNGIIGLIRSGHRIVDPEAKESRAVRWGDIAVLAATNTQVEAIAKALRAAQVPMKMSLAGLLTVPEVCLAKACLRRVSDRTDTLATAEIIAMTDCNEPEIWLADRLRWLAQEQESYAWAEGGHRIVSKLASLRDEITTQSPVEVVARVLNYVGIRDVVTAWGPNATKVMQRQRNLDAFLSLAVEYERHCDAQHLAATLIGFLFWLEHPHSAALDLQPVVTTGNAVHVLTYHKAKGLEWPVVINAHLDFAWPSRLWDVRVETVAAFDPHKPLASRVIRFWPRVFGERTKLPVVRRIADSPIGAAVQVKNDAENRRVAYVGLTRARDTIVLALPGGNPKDDAWLHTFAGDYLLPKGATLELPTGRHVRSAVVTLEGESITADTEPFAPRRFPERQPLGAPLREGVIASAASPIDGAAAGEIVVLGERIVLRGDDMTQIGTALHALIATELINPGRPDRLKRARELLLGYGVDAFFDAEAALAAAHRFREWIERTFAPTRILAEYPVTQVLGDGRVLRGWIDVLLETDRGWVVIDHKSSPRPSAEWASEVVEYSGQLVAYRQALAACGKTPASCWIQFPVGGGVVVLEHNAS